MYITVADDNKVQLATSSSSATCLWEISRSPCNGVWPLRPVYSDTTQLNSTRRRVELSCVATDTLGEGVCSDTTQLN